MILEVLQDCLLGVAKWTHCLLWRTGWGFYGGSNGKPEHVTWTDCCAQCCRSVQRKGHLSAGHLGQAQGRAETRSAHRKPLWKRSRILLSCSYTHTAAGSIQSFMAFVKKLLGIHDVCCHELWRLHYLHSMHCALDLVQTSEGKIYMGVFYRFPYLPDEQRYLIYLGHRVVGRTVISSLSVGPDAYFSILKDMEYTQMHFLNNWFVRVVLLMYVWWEPWKHCHM